jgi:addiction module HigA family antidote
VLQVEFLDRYGISQGEIAKAIGVEATNLCAVIHRRRPVALDLGRLLAMALKTSPEFWLLRQLAWELEHARPLPFIASLPQLTDPRLRDARPGIGLYLRQRELEAERWPLREASG